MVAAWLTTSAEGERAIRQLQRLKTMVSRARKSVRTIASVKRRTLLHSDINEVAIVRAWSIVDAYLVDRPDAVMRKELPVPLAPSPLLGTVHRDLVGSLGNFRRQGEFWKDGMQLDLKPYESKLNDYREVRNAVVHGAGLLRPKFGRKTKAAIAKRLAAAGLPTVGYAGPLPITDADVAELIALAQEFVTWADKNRP